MKKTLMEAYAKRLNFAEDLYKEERGCAMPQAKKSIIAQILNNTNKVLTEAFASTAATQTANVGGVNAPTDQMKKFCLDVSNIALPNLIAMDLVLTKPMTSEYGTVRYLKFVAGVTKGGVTVGQEFNTAFKLGKMDADRAAYTSSSVVESFEGDGTTTAFALGFTQGAQIAKITVAGEATTAYTFADGTVTFTTAPADKAAIRIAYTYDNVVIPQGTIPTIKAEFDTINLQAKARRIAIYYSTLAQYTYKVESGEDLGAKLKEQAMSEIQYEIDNEVTALLRELAFGATATNPVVTFYKKKPIGISLREHYMSILATFTAAGTNIYKATQKYRANFLVVSPEFIEILTLCDGFKANEVKPGPYFLGTIAGLKVFVSPQLENEAYVGFNSNDLAASPAVFAPFMVCTPTMLLEMPDNAAMQGFATLYDLKPLNTALVAGITLNTTDVDPIYVAAEGE
jgi:hypothetical protein